jgi:hypothetical protein
VYLLELYREENDSSAEEIVELLPENPTVEDEKRIISHYPFLPLEEAFKLAEFEWKKWKEEKERGE